MKTNEFHRKEARSERVLFCSYRGKIKKKRVDVGFRYRKEIMMKPLMGFDGKNIIIMILIVSHNEIIKFLSSLLQ